jgi:hypothetical protein
MASSSRHLLIFTIEIYTMRWDGNQPVLLQARPLPRKGESLASFCVEVSGRKRSCHRKRVQSPEVDSQEAALPRRATTAWQVSSVGDESQAGPQKLPIRGSAAIVIGTLTGAQPGPPSLTDRAPSPPSHERLLSVKAGISRRGGRSGSIGCEISMSTRPPALQSGTMNASTPWAVPARMLTSRSQSPQAVPCHWRGTPRSFTCSSLIQTRARPRPRR